MISDLSIKICASLSLPPPSPDNPDSSIFSVSSALFSSSAPPYLLSHHFSLVNNALPSSRRMRHQTNTPISAVASCFFCALSEDSLPHIYSSCSIISSARSLFFRSLSLSLFAVSSSTTASLLVPSPLASHGVCSSAPSPLPAFPLSWSFLVDVNHKYTLPILSFNYAVWRFRKPAHASRSQKSVAWLCNRIVELSQVLYRHALTAPSKKPRLTPSLCPSVQKHDALLATASTDTALAYTDGSALGNPGPSGAGVSIFLQNPGILIDAGASCGHNTNNYVELFALFVCFSELTLSFPRHPFSRVIVFSDSAFAIGVACSKKVAKTHRVLATATRAAFAKLAKLAPTQLHWVRGHASIGGNERVDHIAKHFAHLCAASLHSPSDGLPNYVTSRQPWDVFPLVNLPGHVLLRDLPFASA